MESSGVCPDNITYNIILREELYVRITKSGKQLELSTNDEAKDLFAALSSNGLVPNYWTYRLMVENIIGQGLLEELDKLFLSMEDNGCTADPGMLNFIVRKLLQRGETTRAGT
uniref:Pentacotripeptide-repeat region of PRORP domain-containing protein n=1 Tax=Oryza punctata TaxID=4537 RepID=A0A0E0M993_ORYPU